MSNAFIHRHWSQAESIVCVKSAKKTIAKNSKSFFYHQVLRDPELFKHTEKEREGEKNREREGAKNTETSETSSIYEENKSTWNWHIENPHTIKT